MSNKLIKFLFLVVLAMPVLIFAAEEIAVPAEVSDTLTTTVQNFMTKTATLSTILVAIVQSLKKILAGLNIDISGIKSQAIAIAITVVYVLVNLNVWDDGTLSQADVVLMVQSAISAISGIYGYKLLWRNKEEIKPEENKAV